MGAAFCFLSFALSAQTPEQGMLAQRAKQLMGAGRFADAAVIYRKLSDALPANVGLRLNLGLALHMAGNNKDAIPVFEQVLKAQPQAIPALVSLGTAYLQINQPALAVAPLNKAVAIAPNDVDTRGMLANALLSLGRGEEAAPHFRKLTTLAPQDPRAWVGLGRCYEALAAKSFDGIEKGSAEFLSLVAETRMATGQFRAAFFFYKQAIEKKPSFRGLHAALARVYKATGADASWAAQEEAKEKAQPKPNCIADKQECDYAAGRFADAAAGKSPYWRTRAYNELAIQAFAQLGKLPPSVELQMLKAEIATQRNQHLEAAKELAAALRLAPNDTRVEREYATSLYFAKDYASAIPLLEKEMSRDPKNAEVYFFIGDAYLKLEKTEEALTYLQAAAAYDPKLLPARAALGQALIRAGKQAEAIPHLEAAVSIDADGSSYYQLSRAYQAAGQAEKAKAALGKYQEIRQRNEAEKRDLEEQVQITPPPQ